jgi:hypothetical protein
MRFRVPLRMAAAVFLIGIGSSEAVQDGSPPPITLPPPAGPTMPPASAIAPSMESPSVQAGPEWADMSDCSGWYPTTTYGHWPTNGPSWWQYHCDDRYRYPSVPVWGTDYYYWDGTKSVFYGEWYVYATWDEVTYYELYWFDRAARDWYGDFFWTFCDAIPGLNCDRSP